MIVTQNARDFRRLIGRETEHPGLIILPCLNKSATWDLLHAALTFLASQGNPMVMMVNHVLDAPPVGPITFSRLPDA